MSAMSAEHMSKFLVLHLSWWRPHMIKKNSKVGRKTPNLQENKIDKHKNMRMGVSYPNPCQIVTFFQLFSEFTNNNFQSEKWH